MKLYGEDSEHTLAAANNCVLCLVDQQNFKEARSMTRKLIPVARRIGGDGNDNTLRLRWNYALSLYNDPSATPDDLREAINTLEEIEPTARRVLGGAHPLVGGIEGSLRHAQFLLRAREAPSTSA